MQFLLFTLILYGYTIAGEYNGEKCSNRNEIKTSNTCVVNMPSSGDSMTTIGCINNRSIIALKLNIKCPLGEPLSLDILTDNILYLDIHNLQDIPVSITATHNIPNLRTLAVGIEGTFSITNNSFFNYFPRIEKISIYNTVLQSIPSLSHLHTLTYIGIINSFFSNSPNTQIEEGFVGGLDQLKYLQITNSSPPISTISDLALRGLSSLNTLILDNNNILTVSENLLQHSHRLDYLSLRQNYITFLNLRTFQQLPFLTWIDMTDNPFNCTCDLQWMSIANHKYKISFVNFTCKYPTHYKNMNATSQSLYTSCPPLPLSLQCLNKSTPLCPSPLSCYNTADSYQCSTCPPGYGQVSDSRCLDLDSCSRTPSPCGDNLCINTVGSFYCVPPSNPCDIRNGGCEQKCEFNGSSNWCTCYPGFELVNFTNNSKCEQFTTDNSYQITVLSSIAGLLVTILLITWITLCVRPFYLYKKRQYRGKEMFGTQDIEMEEILPESMTEVNVS